METSVGTVIVILLLAMVGGQWVIIWRLLNRLLIQAHIPSLTPVATTPPSKTQPQRDPRRKIMTIPIDPFAEE